MSEELFEEYKDTIQTLNDAIWEKRVSPRNLDNWLNNFSDSTFADVDKQKLHAIYLLTQFMYFGVREVREMLKYIYVHIYKYPIIRNIRLNNSNTLNTDFLNQKFNEELQKTRFLAMGNPSESGAHLLYYFRQENSIPKDLFIHAHEIFKSTNVRKDGGRITVERNIANPDVTRYIFLDDFCGSGTQAKQYSDDVINELKQCNPACKVYYYMLFATSKGLKRIRTKTNFDGCECIFELDESFKCFSKESRFFIPKILEIEQDFTCQLVKHYGKNLQYGPFGFKSGQNMLAACRPEIFHFKKPIGIPMAA
ncbi:MAG: hypothetical protein WC721_13845 [Victivallaceae bacterium]|jgi:hypothetical protein